MKMNVFCRIILPLLCIISCSKRKEADNTKVLEKNHTFSLWNNDSLGCKHERTIEMGEELYNTFKKSNKNDSILLKEYLGTPNRRFKDKEKIVFMYYINSCCDNGQLLEECDVSFIAITFTNENEILFRKGIQ